MFALQVCKLYLYVTTDVQPGEDDYNAMFV